MPDPILLLVDDDPETLASLASALERRFGADYRVLTERSPTSALARLEQACECGEDVALVVAHLWAPEMTGLDLLARVHDLCPRASRCALVSYGDGPAYQHVRRAFVLGQLDTYLLKPWGDPEERLYPVVSEILGSWARSVRPRVALLHIVGERWAPRSHEMRDLLERSSFPYRFYSHDSDEGQRLLRDVGHAGGLPAVIFGDRCLTDPTNLEVARMLGVKFLLIREITGLAARGPERIVTLAETIDVSTRTVVIATGVSYNRLEIDGLDGLLGKGVFYGAATAEAPAFAGRHVFVIGAGNSAGQGAVHLARYAASVTLLMRGASPTMSDYLARQIERASNIQVRLNTELLRVHGRRRLEAVEVNDTARGVSESLPGSALFVFVGAGPHTSWLEKVAQRDAQGHMLTGRHVVRGAGGLPRWDEDREPYVLETSLPGVFAAGDVRHNSPRGVAAAVADRAIAIRSVREYLRHLEHAGYRGDEGRHRL